MDSDVTSAFGFNRNQQYTAVDVTVSNAAAVLPHSDAESGTRRRLQV